VSVKVTDPDFPWARSAQAEERKDRHDHDDQTDEINQAVHGIALAIIVGAPSNGRGPGKTGCDWKCSLARRRSIRLSRVPTRRGKSRNGVRERHRGRFSIRGAALHHFTGATQAI